MIDRLSSALATRHIFGFRASRHSHLLRGSTWLVVNVGVMALSGFLFWLLAARLFAQEDVGAAAGLFASLQFVTYATNMGLSVATARYAADRAPDVPVLMGWALVWTAGTSVVGSIAYLAIVRLPSGPGFLGTADVALFASLVVGTSVSVVVDMRLIAGRRAQMVMWRSLATGVARLILLILPTHVPVSTWLFVASAAPQAITAALALIYLQRLPDSGIRLWPLSPRTSEALRYASVNYLSLLASGAPAFVLPVIVITHVQSSAAASFYLAWSLTSTVFLVPPVIGQALLVEGVRDLATARSLTRTAMWLSGVLMALATAGALAFSGLVTFLYGPAYGAAATLWSVLTVGAVPWAITSSELSLARIRHDHVGIIAMTFSLGVTVLGLALVLMPLGAADGAAGAWVVGHWTTAALALLLGRRASRAIRNGA
jgi:O-antigen/teichoic acid export membrane protein